MKRLLLLIVVVLLVAAALSGPSTSPNPGPGPSPVVATKAFALFVYDHDAPPKVVDSRELRDWMDQHSVSYDFVGPKTQIGDDLPEFKKLMEQPRQADNWLYVHGGVLRKDDSVPMPADEAAAEKIIGKHAR